MAKVPADVGCRNDSCKEIENCKRFEIAKTGKAREIKKFGGTPQKGCGKFLPKA